MNIDFHTPAGDTQEWLIDHIKKKLTELHHLYQQISRADVFFKRNPVAFDGEYVCEIDLTIFGSSIMVSYSAESFVRSASEAIAELEKQVQAQVHKNIEPPDDLFSSVDV